jgi:hypothetical protein
MRTLWIVLEPINHGFSLRLRHATVQQRFAVEGLLQIALKQFPHFGKLGIVSGYDGT